ncbi:rapid alkalinization factor [Brachypodium distachyon]|uniref:Rapid alkalinization factor 1 n=1 Tax=Brachypodium distachyon TaxID=15368 RepID=I1IHS3_BRADI|nr:rapid alkalinization factor [Brachypodium distachyon]KQJ86440.1 hypothetical protein BRADI_4g05500v3 [Brachypodium distachyon]|eukprot:XP_003575694.1 rapid alkalinization factor [Brachypodium distachyon]
MAGVAKSLVVLFLLVAALSASASASSSMGAGGDLQLGLFSSSASASDRETCTVGECGGGEDEDAEGELGSASAEAHRRILAGRGYISYGALRRGTVPCNRRGASYYNCRPGAQANPYHRGCSRITRCRG